MTDTTTTNAVINSVTLPRDQWGEVLALLGVRMADLETETRRAALFYNEEQQRQCECRERQAFHLYNHISDQLITQTNS